MQEEERKVTLTTTREIGKCWWWMSWRCTTALSSWRTSSNWTEMPTAGTKGVITSSSTTDLEMLRVETDSFKSVDTLTLSTQGIYHLHGIIFILYLWRRKIIIFILYLWRRKIIIFILYLWRPKIIIFILYLCRPKIIIFILYLWCCKIIIFILYLWRRKIIIFNLYLWRRKIIIFILYLCRVLLWRRKIIIFILYLWRRKIIIFILYLWHRKIIIFILYLWRRKISPLCHLSVTTCTQVRLFDPTWLLTSILHAKVYGTIHSYIVAHIEAGCKWVPISYFFSLWKPRNERNYASNKKSRLKGKRSAALLKWPTVMKELRPLFSPLCSERLAWASVHAAVWSLFTSLCVCVRARVCACMQFI